MNLNVIHNRAAHRFEVEVDGTLCLLEYRLESAVLSILHTGVPAAVGGRGIAASLTLAAFKHARETGLKVRPLCSYAAQWLVRHPEYADLAT